MKRIYKTVKINAGWINTNIVKPGWQRNLYPSRVNYFMSKMRNEQFIKSLITVAEDKQTGKFILLDGQHKIEAISKYEKSFDMDVCVYEGLNEIEMIEVYNMLNDVKAPRLIDDIKTYVGRHEWLDKLLDRESFPINVTLNGGVNAMRIDALLNVLSNGLRNTISRYNLSRRKLSSFLQELDQNRYFLIKEFCAFYKDCFGEPSSENWLYKNVVMFTLFRIWVANKKNYKRETLLECFRRVETKPDIRRETYVSAVANLENLTRMIYKVLNYHRSSNYFIIFWDDYIKMEK